MHQLKLALTALALAGVLGPLAAVQPAQQTLIREPKQMWICIVWPRACGR
ncbi:hypothetical protein G7070_08680 [Propioniciclava coleopterorum]|uniref:Uncharacterized protein n=1 Tax=Propioniciclava coleopterorum TaxID=2714937 RepID=A0A6G7Y6S8_9ACTN|nr:hypothetical protein [Propioniciclava coleopterorum]QIK72331.1 hypothetical protein G7070_08680 [Propioniciclava coleopterorum]